MNRTEDDLRETYAELADTASEGNLLRWLDEHTRDAVQPVRRHRVLPVLAAACVVVLALAGIWLAKSGPSHRQAPVGPGPSSVPAVQGVQGVFVDPAHPRTLQLVVMIGSAPAGGGTPAARCTDRGVPTVTKQNDRSVTVHVRLPKTHESGELSLCTDSVATDRVQLNRPLDSRHVVDDLSGRSVPVVDLSTVPVPKSEPSGYTAEPIKFLFPEVSAGGVVSDGGFSLVGHDPVDISNPFVQRTYRDGSDVLTITAGKPDTASKPDQQRADRDYGRRSVDGHAAHVMIFPKSHDSVCITWQPSASRAINVCGASDPLSAQPPGPAPFSIAQVLAIAQNLR